MKKRARRASDKINCNATPYFGSDKVGFDTTSNFGSLTTASNTFSSKPKVLGEVSPRQKYVIRLYCKNQSENSRSNSDNKLEVNQLSSKESTKNSTNQNKYKIPTLKEVKRNRRLKIRENFKKSIVPVTDQ